MEGLSTGLVVRPTSWAPWGLSSLISAPSTGLLPELGLPEEVAVTRRSLLVIEIGGFDFFCETQVLLKEIQKEKEIEERAFTSLREATSECGL